MTWLISGSIALMVMPAFCVAVLLLVPAGAHEDDGWERRRVLPASGGSGGRHRKHVRVGETAVCPESNGYSLPVHRQRRSPRAVLRRLVARLRGQASLSAWFWLQRDTAPAALTVGSRRV